MSMACTGASPQAIRFHYDLSNAFYARWLDEEMSYSCALFADDEDSNALDAAQSRKLDLLAQWAGVRAGHRVLDVGCGWGAMLRRLVGHHGVTQATGLSLSVEQTEWIRHATDPRIDARIESWRDHVPSRPYDAIVSIEAIEAFVGPGRSRAEKVTVYREFFERCHEWLVPGGGLALQTIAYGNSDARDLDEFIATQIFPESDLPTLDELVTAMDHRFEVRALVNEREQYVRTVRAWLARLRTSRDSAVASVGEEAVRRYQRYLRLCTYLFASGNCNLYRIALRRIDHPRLRGTPVAGAFTPAA